MVDPLAASFARWIRRRSKGSKAITLWTRAEGAADDYGNPTITYTASTISAIVQPARLDWIQTDWGIVLEEYCVVDVASTITVAALDNVTIDSIRYEVGPPETRSWGVRFPARRIIQS